MHQPPRHTAEQRFLLSLIAAIFLLTAPVHTQAPPCPVTWGPTIQISNTPSSAFVPKLAIVGDTVHVVYVGYTVYYRRSTDAGKNWGPQVVLVPADSMSASLGNRPLAVSGQTVSLVWANRNASGAITSIKIRRSTDGGETWLEPQVIASSTSSLRFSDPMVAARGSNVFVVMIGQSFNNYRNYLIRTFDGGGSWDSLRAITTPSQVMGSGDIHATPLGIHLVGGQVVQPSGGEITYMMSPDDGETWSAQQVLSTIDTYQAWEPNVAADDAGNVYVCWQDAKYGTIGGFDGALLLRRSTDNGITWMPEQRIGSLPSVERSAISVSGSYVHVSWEDNRFGSLSPRVYYSGSIDNGSAWCDEVMLADSSLVSLNTSVAAVGTSVYTVWSMRIPSIAQVFFRKGDAITRVVEEHTVLPQRFTVSSAYPNPFNPSAIVEYAVPSYGRVSIRVFDNLGRMVTSLYEGMQDAGLYRLRIDGSSWASGVYYVVFQFEQQRLVKRVVLMR